MSHEEHAARYLAMAARYGRPETVRPYDALLMAMNAPQPVTLHVSGNEVHASIYRDQAAADAYAAANLEYHGHPTLAQVTLADGRVLGILNLRPALKAARDLRDAAKRPKGLKP